MSPFVLVLHASLEREKRLNNAKKYLVLIILLSFRAGKVLLLLKKVNLKTDKT